MIDEFGTFAGMAARMYRRAVSSRRRWTGGGRSNDKGKEPGRPPPRVAVHQPNLRLFGDSGSRGQYGYRLITGAYTTSLWAMTFGFAPRIEWDARIKGRGASSASAKLRT